MKKVIAIAALATLVGSAYAQLKPLPGKEINPSPTAGVNGDAAHWGSASTLGAYQFASDDNLGTPKPGTPDNRLGLHWKATVGAGLQSIFNGKDLNDSGTIRVIFLGESAGWVNDFGYAYDGNPKGASSFSLWNNIQAAGGTPNVQFGSYADIKLGQDEGKTFDFWLSASNSTAPNWDPYPTTNGGYYTARFPALSSPAIGSGNARWSQDALAVNTWLPDLGKNALVDTYLLSLEDWRLDKSPDGDYNDFMVALQFFDAGGNPLTPVPEPSTYGLIGGAALLGLVIRRRFSKK